MASPRTTTTINTSSSISSHHKLPPSKRKSLTKINIVQNQTIQPNESTTLQKDKQKSYGLNLSVNTDKKYSDEMDNVSLFQNVRQAEAASAGLRPDSKKQILTESIKQTTQLSRGSWVLNSSLTQRNQSLSHIIEPGYLQRIRKYCGSDSDEISTEEDT